MRQFWICLISLFSLCSLSMAVPVQITLASGDADGDNSVNLFDSVVLDTHYGENSQTPGWNPIWDVDCSGSIDSFDYMVVDAHSGEQGVAALSNCSGTPTGSSVISGTISIPDINVTPVTLPITFQVKKVGATSGYQFNQNISFTSNLGSFQFNVDSPIASYVLTVYAGHFLRMQVTVSADAINSAAPWHPNLAVRNGTISVDAYSGTLRHTAPIVGWKSKGLPMDLTLSYNSSNPATPWTHSYRSYITDDTSSATVYFGNGDIYKFTLSNGVYTAPAGYKLTLTKDAQGIYTLSTLDAGSLYVYDTDKRLASVKRYTYYKLSPPNAGPQYASVNLTYTNGFLTQVTDTTGNRSLVLGYSSGRLSSITDPLNRVWNLNYTNGLLTSIQLPALTGGTRYTQNYQYTNGVITRVTDTDSKYWNIAYTAGLATGLVDPSNRRVYGMTYYGGNTVVDVAGYVANRYVFNSSGAAASVQEWISPSWVTVGSTERDASFDVTKVTDRRGQDTTYTYISELGRPKQLGTVVSPDGVSTVYGYSYYDGPFQSSTTTTINGNYQTEQHYASASNQLCNTYNRFYVGGLLWAQTSASSQIKDEYGNVTETVNELGVKKRYTYTPNGDLEHEQVVLANETTTQNVATYTYDAVGRRASSLDRLGKTTTYTYDNVDRVVSVSLPNSVVLNYTYDNAGRVLNVTRSIAGGTAVTIDAKTYNNIGQLASHTNALSNTEYTNYGWNALPSTYTSYRGKQTTLGYDLHGLNTLTTHPMGNAVSTTRNAAGDITLLYDGVRTANFGIDSAGRVQTATYGSDPIITNTYLDGNADTITQNGSVTAYKPVIVGFASSTVNGSIYNWQMKNTAQGFMGTSSLYGTDSTDTSTNVRRIRSAIGVSETNVTPDVVTDQFFDQEGRLTGVTRRSRVNYNLYSNISQNNVSYTYYLDGRLSLTTYGNGNTEARTYADIYSGSYDIGDRITVVTTTNGSTITKVMDYNAIGQMVSTTVNDLKRTLYAYDLKGQLLTETKQEKQNNVWVTVLTTTYTFDADGNRLTRTRTGNVTESTSYTCNDANQLTTMVQNGTTTTYAYNSAGELTTITRNGQSIALTWTGMGRMNGFGTNAYSYNALGQLVSVNSLRAKSIFGDSAASQVWRDGDTEQLWGLGLAGRFSPTLTEFNHQGVPGSVEMTTAPNGVINGSLEMDAYGDLETATGNLQWGQTPYRYIGGLNCQSEGLAYFGGGTGEGNSYRLIMMGERWYDPQVGRFISRDPVFSENLYAYCGNDPVNAVDPEGRDADEWIETIARIDTIQPTGGGPGRLPVDMIGLVSTYNNTVNKQFTSNIGDIMATGADFYMASQNVKNIWQWAPCVKYVYGPQVAAVAEVAAPYAIAAGYGYLTMLIYDKAIDRMRELGGSTGDYDKRMGVYPPRPIANIPPLGYNPFPGISTGIYTPPYDIYQPL